MHEFGAHRSHAYLPPIQCSLRVLPCYSQLHAFLAVVPFCNHAGNFRQLWPSVAECRVSPAALPPEGNRNGSEGYSIWTGIVALRERPSAAFLLQLSALPAVHTQVCEMAPYPCGGKWKRRLVRSRAPTLNPASLLAELLFCNPCALYLTLKSLSHHLNEATAAGGASGGNLEINVASKQ